MVRDERRIEMKSRKSRIITAVVLSVMLVFTAAPITTFAETDSSITVNVTIKNSTFTQPLVNLNGVTKTPAWTGILFGKTVKIKVEENEQLGDAIADHLGGFVEYSPGYFSSFDGLKGSINIEEYTDPQWGSTYDASGFQLKINGEMTGTINHPIWGPGTQAGVNDYINTTAAIIDNSKLKIKDNDNVLFAYCVDGAEINQPYVSAPTGLSAKPTGTKTINISWATKVNATGYEVYASSSKNGTYKKIGSCKTNSYKHTNLTPGKVYYYKVKMVRNQNMSPLSKYAATAAKPSKPVIKVSKKGKKALKVRWKKTKGAKYYQVYRATKKNGKYKKIKTVSASKLSYTNKKLKSGKKYYYKVRALTKVDSKIVYSSFSTKKSGRAG